MLWKGTLQDHQTEQAGRYDYGSRQSTTLAAVGDIRGGTDRPLASAAHRWPSGRYAAAHSRRGNDVDGVSPTPCWRWEVVVVLGHPGYYPRFGFVPAHRLGLRCEYDAPAEAFMALEVRPAALGPSIDRLRLVQYSPEFGAL